MLSLNNLEQKDREVVNEWEFDFVMKRTANGYLTQGTFCNELITQWATYVLPIGKIMTGTFLYRPVRFDAFNFLKNRIVKLPIEYPTIVTAKAPRNFTELIGTDITSAYCFIAKNKKIISETTFHQGLGSSVDKQIRLATLSTLGKGKYYQTITDYKISKRHLHIGKNKKLASVYSYIRLTCFMYMNSLKRLLGKDFYRYETDCIFYKRTEKNRKLVHDYLTKKNLYFKDKNYTIKKTIKKSPTKKFRGTF